MITARHAHSHRAAADQQVDHKPELWRLIRVFPLKGVGARFLEPFENCLGFRHGSPLLFRQLFGSLTLAAGDLACGPADGFVRRDRALMAASSRSSSEPENA